jgi:hypothetical protein
MPTFADVISRPHPGRCPASAPATGSKGATVA